VRDAPGLLRASLPARGGRLAGAGCIVVGEVAQAHDGSLGMAHAFIDAIADAGADAVKFQTHIASAESTPQEPWRVKFSPQDRTRYDYWKRTEFTEDAWHGLKKHADERSLWFLSSPFSEEAAELLGRVGVAAWKVASGETSNLPLLERLTRDGRPVLLSTGLSPLAEIDAAVRLVQSKSRPLAVLQCTSAYPCPPEKVGLNLIPFFRDRYGCAVGLSDHSGTIYPGLAAAVVAIEMLEVHVAFSRQMFGPDVPASVTMEEFKQLNEGVRFIERMAEHPIDKDESAKETAPLHTLFTKSVVARMDLREGTILQVHHLGTKKPGTGLPAARLPELIGRRLRRDVKADERIGAEELEEDR
jgi:N,N'-diacetyllegionaminate synthase